MTSFTMEYGMHIFIDTPKVEPSARRSEPDLASRTVPEPSMSRWRAGSARRSKIFSAGAGMTRSTETVASLAAMGSLAILFKFWTPKDKFAMTEGRTLAEQGVASPRHPAGEIFMAWLPYILLVIIVLVWGYNQTFLRGVSKVINWPGLHNAVEIVPPVSKIPGPYAAAYRFDWLSASGTARVLSRGGCRVPAEGTASFTPLCREESETR